jgi:PTH1 family peptidyl-tRNA hydrolase
MYMIAGLGNPERKYDGTRHNAGFATIDALLDALGGLKLNETKFDGAYTKTSYQGESLVIVKPLTYMNLSGKCLAPLANFYKIPAENIIVISDDIDLGVGCLRLRQNGSAGGHNGLKSIIECLGTDQFLRVRVGVGGKPDARMDLAAHVLGKFTGEDEKTIGDMYRTGAEACLDIVTNGMTHAMNHFNIKKANV